MTSKGFVLIIVVVSISLLLSCTKNPTDNPLIDNPDIYFEVVDNKIMMHHNAVYDCCAVMRIIITQDETMINFVEQDLSTEKCDSLCTFRLKGTTSKLNNGYYDCSIWNSDMADMIYRNTVCVQGDNPG